MQKITVLCVGKLKERFYQEAAAEYVKRLGRHCKLDVVELPESRLPEDPTPGEKSCPGAGRSSPCASRGSPAPAWS